MRAQKLFQLTTIPELLFALTVLLLEPVSTAPQGLFGNSLARRAENTAGIGVELEFGNIQIVANPPLTSEQQEKIKGTEMKPVGFDGGTRTNWMLTAEIDAVTKGALLPVAIVDGLKNKVGAHQTKQIGEEIFSFLVCLYNHLSSPRSLVPLLIRLFL